MRQLAALLFVALVVLAGCSVPFTAGNGSAGNDTTPEASPTSSGNATTAPTTGGESDGTTKNTSANESGQQAGRNFADPGGDVLGWENGVWYNESISIVGENGLNETERRTVVNRTMARIERIRRLEFEKTVPVEVITRDEYRQRPGGVSDPSRALRLFDNTKFEALFMIGEETNSFAVQESNRNQSVAGFYSPTNDEIVVISESGTPRLSRSTLAHELVHALQDQQFDLTSSMPATRDAYNARNGVIEGEANYIQDRYKNRCSGEWQCIEMSSKSTNTSNATSSGLHRGVYYLQYFPYSDGPGFVDYVYDRRGWEGVNALHRDLPTSAEQVIYPEKYNNDTPTNPTIENTPSNGWTRVEPGRPGRVDYATLGQSALSSMFSYTLYDSYNRSRVVGLRQVLNFDGASINRSDPIDYDLNYTDGWDGDKMFVYQKRNRTGYVWKLAWDSPAEAREFVAGYEQLLAHWGGSPTDDAGNVWRVNENSPFTDAFRISRQGNTVTIVNAPTVEGLDAIHANATGS